MNIDQFNKWLAPLTNLAVLVGLLLIVVELRQNEESIELDRRLALIDSTHNDFSSFGDLRQLVIADPSIAELYIRGGNGEQLSDVDGLRFWYLCLEVHWSAVLMYDRAMQLERRDYADATVSYIHSTLRREGMKSCWERAKGIYESWGYDEFVEAVDRKYEVETDTAREGDEPQES